MTNLPQEADGSAPQRAAIYTRVSTGRQAEEGYSLPEQERRSVARVEHKGWTLVRTYREEGVSGAKESRPALNRMLADLDDIDVVVVSSLDRLGRSTKHLLEMYDVFDRERVALVSLREEIDTSTPVGRLLRTVLSAVAEFERDLGRERTSAGIGSRARTGQPWGEPAYGYTKGAAGRWIAEPAETAIVRRIYAEYVDRGGTYSGVAQWLNAEGIKSRRGGRWTPTVVKRLLTSRHVLGYFEHLGDWHEGTHDPVIDRAMWDAAQAHAERGRKYAPRGGGRLPKRHLFVRGALRCGCCGEAMLPRSASDQADVYVCRTRKQTGGADACPMPPVKRDVVDGAALSLFESWALDVEGTRDRIATTIDARVAEIRAQAERAGREVSEKRAQLARVVRDYLAGELGAASHDRLIGRVSEELTAAEAEVARLDAHAADVADLRTNLDAEHEALRRLAVLRSAVCERVGRAAADAREHADIAAVRSAMAAVFSEVRLVPAGHHPASNAAREGTVPEYGAWLSKRTPESLYVVPIVRAEMLQDEAWSIPDRDMLRRVPIVLGGPDARPPASGSRVSDYETTSGVPL